jgi:predicted dehydrogenase
MFFRIQAFGRNGSVEATSRTDIIIRKSRAEAIRLKYPENDSVRVNLEHFADAIDGGPPYPVTPEIILNVTNAFVGIADAIRTGVVTQEV